MKDYTRLYDKEIKNDYSVNSGAFAVIDENIKMELNEYGQYQPVLIDKRQKKSKHDDKLALVSAMSDESQNEDEIAADLFSDIPGSQHNKVIGYYLDLYAGHVAEGNYRQKASSGGITTWLLVQMLEKGLIDGVVHVREARDGDGILFKYAISSNPEEIRSGAKSRYYPAEFSEAIKVIKKTRGKYAITGIPSFITEIRLLAQQDKIVSDRIAYTFGLICGHQKSTKYAEALAWQHGIKPGNLRSIDFRVKAEGELAINYLTEMQGIKDGQEVRLIRRQDEFFVSNWAHGFFKSKLSDYTDDAFNETADISLGDAWLEEYVKDSGGNNILIIRNPDIAKVIKEGINSKALYLDRITSDTVIRSQRGLVHHTQDELPYRLHKKDEARAWRPIKRFNAVTNLPFLRKRVQDVREKIATESHKVYQEAVKRDDWQYFESKMRPYIIQYNLIYKIIHLKNKGAMGLAKSAILKLKL